MRNVIDILEERGFIDAVTHDDIRTVLEKPQTVYLGVDPTGDSVHLGNMVAMMGLAWFQRCGHTPIALVGGATGMVGDPSGKSAERPLLTPEVIEKNCEGIRKDLHRLLDANHPTAKPVMVNNYDWFGKMGVLDFLRDVGKYFRVGPMLAKDSVKSRLNSEEGMSYTEFSYQLLQGYDFLHLYNNHGCTLQIGGSDQWGNITAGTELVRRLAGGQAYGVTFPLLTRSDGKKFGKSEAGTIWLSEEKISPYEFYQYLVRIPDADVGKMLRLFTFLEMDEIRAIEGAMTEDGYQPNTAQKRLAEEVTRIVHGEEGLQTALKVTAGARPGAETALDAETLEAIAADMPNAELPVEALLNQKVLDVLVTCGLQKSKGEGRRLVRNGGLYLNNKKVSDENAEIGQEDLIDGRMLLLATGKKRKLLVRVSGG